METSVSVDVYLIGASLTQEGICVRCESQGAGAGWEGGFGTRRLCQSPGKPHRRGTQSSYRINRSPHFVPSLIDLAQVH